MTLAFANSIGSANSKAATTSIALTTTDTVEERNVIVVRYGGDNLSTADGDNAEVTSVTDTNSNVYTKVHEHTNSNAAAGTGATVSLWQAVANSDLTSGSTITVNLSGSVTAKAIAADEFTKDPATTLVVAQITQAAGDAADPAALTLSGLASREYLFLWVLAVEAPSTDTITQDADYTALTKDGTTGGGGTTNIYLGGGFRIFTGTTDTVDAATSAARDHAQIYAAIYEQAATTSQPLPELPSMDETFAEGHDYSGFTAWLGEEAPPPDDAQLLAVLPQMDETFAEVFNFEGWTAWQMPDDVVPDPTQPWPEFPQIDEVYFPRVPQDFQFAQVAPDGPSSSAVGVPRWPLALHLYESPGGALIRAFYAVTGLNPSTNEHGFEALSGFEAMHLWEAFWLYDLAPAKWLVLTAGPMVVWEGRVEDRKIQAGGFGFTALGAKRAFDDAPYTGLWSTKSFAGIRPVTADEIAKSTPERWAMDNNNRLWFGLVNGETYNNDDHYGVQVFRQPNRAETTILEVEWTYSIDLPTNWQVRLISYDEGFATAVVEWTFTSTGVLATASVTQTLAAGKAFITFQVRNNTGGNVTFAGATGSASAKITALRIKGSVNTSIFADEIVEGLVAFVSGLNSGQASSSYAGVQSPNVDLTDELFEDMTPGQVLDYLAEKGDDQTPPRKWEWGVWEDQLLYFRPQGDVALAWYVDAEELTLDSTLQTLINSAYAVYQDANGRTLRTAVATEAESVGGYGITRRGMAQAQTTSQTTAETARDRLVNDSKDIAPRAQLVLYGLFDASGARYPLWMARAGDQVTIRNLPPNLSQELDRIRTFRLTRTVYDVDNDVLTPTPEFPLPEIEIQIASTLAPRVPGL